LTFDKVRAPGLADDPRPMNRWEESQGHGDGAGPVARLVYASRANLRDGIYAEMERIRASALRHNAPLGIATALLHQSGWFVQWKEGPADALLKTMDRVAADPRHRDVRVVHRSRGARLLAGPWSMAIVQCRETALDMEQRVLRLKRDTDAGATFAPPASWRRLSTPMCHPGALRQSDPDAFQRVLVCSAAGTTAFDLAGALARLHGAELVHRRFAGAGGGDVATDYVDFAFDQRVWRVIAMARHGLNLPLTRAFLPDYSHVLLLLSIDGDHNLQLMERVLRALSRLQRRPILMGVGSQPEMHRVPMALATRFGLSYAPVVADSREPLAAWKAAQPLLARWHAANSSAIEPDTSPAAL
jgi:hypothetical protein